MQHHTSSFYSKSLYHIGKQLIIEENSTSTSLHQILLRLEVLTQAREILLLKRALFA